MAVVVNPGLDRSVDKCIRVYSNQKLWMTREVKQLLRERNTAFRSGNHAHYSTARANLKRGIRQAKLDYRRRIEDHLDSNNNRQVWQGVQSHQFQDPGAAEGDATLAEKLSLFFARFEVEPAETATPHLMALSNLTLTVEESKVKHTLRSVNPRKATGPDSVPARGMKDCVDQLAVIFTKIFNQFLALSNVTPCLKSSIIVPLPKKSHISSLSDYRPIALTPVLMKCFEKVRSHITSLLPPSFDSHQFVYRGNRSTEDTVATALHAALSHLEKQGSYVWMVFVDYSSVFNTILAQILVDKLEDLGLRHSTCMWADTHLRPSASAPAPHRALC
ncbi:hypothetical protein QTP70_013188 [Hemibagrus guttatus]|uniref:Reverse transcriptase domain-containing protein n=1 Tax=Hemibagrus guttatus TaxID=175788 RepID=A0AAE0R369_9TELE|nr:hypothetical protein QTP70_013188 [Hemibagrus guttatus]